MDQLEILDCTIRDGGYLNNWAFSDEQVREAYRAASEAGFDYFEIGFRSAREDFDPEKYGSWIYCDEEDVRRVTDGIAGAKLVVMSKIDNQNINIHHFIPRKKSVISMVRVLLPYIGSLSPLLLRKAKTLCEQLIDYGYEVTLNIACIDKFTDLEFRTVCEEIAELDLKYLYFADTYGATSVEQIRQRVGEALSYFRERGSVIGVGFHAHNNLQDSYSRSIEAFEAGARIIDGCMAGLGRGAGNLPSELIVGHLYKETSKPFFRNRYDMLPLMRYIDQHLIGYQERLPNRMNWGYNSLYVLTGFTSCHPSYATELIEREEKLPMTRAFDIIHALLESGKYLNYNKTFITEYLATHT